MEAPGTRLANRSQQKLPLLSIKLAILSLICIVLSTYNYIIAEAINVEVIEKRGVLIYCIFHFIFLITLHTTRLKDVMIASTGY